MNVCIEQPRWPSLAIGRIIDAFRANAPSDVEFTLCSSEADLVILPVTGRRDHTLAKIKDILFRGRKYAIIQLSLKSTRNPNPADWLELWQGASVVWSYYDLPGKFNFYQAPMGADHATFFPLSLDRNFSIAITGEYTRTECIWECDKASRNAGLRNLHIKDASDEEINYYYNQCRYVNGLRHKEGFELPAAEGLLAGTRPVMFDTVNFRRWFDGLATFIPEEDQEKVANRLTRLFLGRYSEVSDRERTEATRRFDWSSLMKGFWDRCL